MAAASRIYVCACCRLTQPFAAFTPSSLATLRLLSTLKPACDPVQFISRTVPDTSRSSTTAAGSADCINSWNTHLLPGINTTNSFQHVQLLHGRNAVGIAVHGSAFSSSTWNTPLLSATNAANALQYSQLFPGRNAGNVVVRGLHQVTQSRESPVVRTDCSHPDHSEREGSPAVRKVISDSVQERYAERDENPRGREMSYAERERIPAVRNENHDLKQDERGAERGERDTWRQLSHTEREGNAAVSKQRPDQGLETRVERSESESESENAIRRELSDAEREESPAGYSQPATPQDIDDDLDMYIAPTIPASFKRVRPNRTARMPTDVRREVREANIKQRQIIKEAKLMWRNSTKQLPLQQHQKQHAGPRASMNADQQQEGPRASMNADQQQEGPRASMNADQQQSGSRASMNDNHQPLEPQASTNTDQQQEGSRASMNANQQQSGPRASMGADQPTNQSPSLQQHYSGNQTGHGSLSTTDLHHTHLNKDLQCDMRSGFHKDLQDDSWTDLHKDVQEDIQKDLQDYLQPGTQAPTTGEQQPVGTHVAFDGDRQQGWTQASMNGDQQHADLRATMIANQQHVGARASMDGDQQQPGSRASMNANRQETGLLDMCDDVPAGIPSVEDLIRVAVQGPGSDENDIAASQTAADMQEIHRWRSNREVVLLGLKRDRLIELCKAAGVRPAATTQRGIKKKTAQMSKPAMVERLLDKEEARIWGSTPRKRMWSS